MVPGPNGLTIASDDLEALDEFERLLSTSTVEVSKGPMAIFYLKYAQAPEVAETLDKILAGGASEADNLFNKPSAGARLSSGPAPLATGSVKITAETRLNALIVLANHADQETVRQLLKILDMKESPEDVASRPSRG